MIFAFGFGGSSLGQDPSVATRSSIQPPPGLENQSGPWNDPDDFTVWPNQTSRANSDPWLAEHHDQIERMRPRVLLINFSNEHSNEQLRQLTKQLIAALAECSRYHGYRDSQIQYPSADKMVVTHRGEKHTVNDYVAVGGNAHFPPNARGHYDLNNPSPVLSTIEDWRIGSGPSGKDLAKPFTNKAFQLYRELAPDCMGAWLVYWRQNMPGFRNRQKDDEGRPMKNWIPFLFY